MSDIITLYKEYKSDVEKQEFIEKQHKTITSLLDKNKQLEEEIKHLKKLLEQNISLIGDNQEVQRIIITPEEHLIETQIEMVRDRGINNELSLEDTKKLDLLLKNKKIIKDKQEEIIKAKSTIKFDKKEISNAELVKLAQSVKSDDI